MSDVCSSYLLAQGDLQARQTTHRGRRPSQGAPGEIAGPARHYRRIPGVRYRHLGAVDMKRRGIPPGADHHLVGDIGERHQAVQLVVAVDPPAGDVQAEIDLGGRSEEHTSELQSLMRISYSVLCLKQKSPPNA